MNTRRLPKDGIVRIRQHKVTENKKAYNRKKEKGVNHNER